jgi:predicted integral membrane protein DUF2269
VDPATGLKVLHALSGALLLSGLVARWVSLGAASQAGDVHDVRTLLDVSSRFERLVIAMFFLVGILGVSTAIAQGRPFLGPLQGHHVDWLFVSFVLYLLTIPLVPLVFVPRGKVFGAALERAGESGPVPDDLRAAFHDRAVLAAHLFELIGVFVVFALMVGKPF